MQMGMYVVMLTNPHVDFEGTEQGKLRVYQAVGTEGF